MDVKPSITTLLKKVYLSALLGGLIAFVPVAIFFSLNSGISFGLGVLIGIFPFITWHVLIGLLIPGKDITRIRKVLLFGVSVIKIAFIGVVLYLIVQLRFFRPIPFVAGMVITLPIILIMVVLYYSRLKE